MRKGGFSSYEDCIAPRPVPNCSFCGAPFTDVGRTGCYCIPCKSASYCGAECQRKHWPQHKSLCRAESTRRFDVSLAFAERGSPGAMFYVATYYACGYGVKKNAEAAIMWARSAAERKHPEAAYNLATYLTDAGGADNAAEAMKWMRKAADLGLSQAQVVIAKRHMKGGPEEDLPKAATWLKRAADKGNALACRLLADAYIHEQGLPCDFKEALRYMHAGAALGDARSHWGVAQLLLRGFGTPDGKPDLLTATHHLHKAAFLGNQAAQVMLGHEYAAEPPARTSELVSTDKPQALAWFRLAAAGPPCSQQEDAAAGAAALERAGVVAMQLSGVVKRKGT